MGVALYMDEQVPGAITRGLRRRGVDVLTAQDDGHDATDDEIILDRAATLGRVIFTRDQDFLVIAEARHTNRVPFAGVVFARQRNGPLSAIVSTTSKPSRPRLTWTNGRTP